MDTSVKARTVFLLLAVSLLVSLMAHRSIGSLEHSNDVDGTALANGDDISSLEDSTSHWESNSIHTGTDEGSLYVTEGPRMEQDGSVTPNDETETTDENSSPSVGQEETVEMGEPHRHHVVPPGTTVDSDDDHHGLPHAMEGMASEVVDGEEVRGEDVEVTGEWEREEFAMATEQPLGVLPEPPTAAASTPPSEATPTDATPIEPVSIPLPPEAIVSEQPPPITHPQPNEALSDITDEATPTKAAEKEEEEGEDEEGEEGEDEGDDVPTFTEFSQRKRMEQDSSQKTFTEKVAVPLVATGGKNNYASLDCGAKIVASNKQAQNPSAILSENRDEYMINPCSTEIWFVVELCELVELHSLQIACFELFSSIPKSFNVSVSERFPSDDWRSLGTMHASNEREIQSFPLAVDESSYAKYVRVDMVSHYGSEHFCPLSLLRVVGASMMEVYEYSESQQEHQVEPSSPTVAPTFQEDMEDDIFGSVLEGNISQGLTEAARASLPDMVVGVVRSLLETVNGYISPPSAGEEEEEEEEEGPWQEGHGASGGDSETTQPSESSSETEAGSAPPSVTYHMGEEQGMPAEEDEGTMSDGAIPGTGTDSVQTSEVHSTTTVSGVTAESPQVHSEVPSDMVHSSDVVHSRTIISPSDDTQHEASTTAEESLPTPTPTHQPRETANPLQDLHPHSEMVTDELTESSLPSGPVVGGGGPVVGGGGAVVGGGGPVVGGGGPVVGGGGPVVGGGVVAGGGGVVVDGAPVIDGGAVVDDIVGGVGVVNDGGAVADSGGVVVDSGGAVADSGGAVVAGGSAVVDDGAVVDNGGTLNNNSGDVLESDSATVDGNGGTLVHVGSAIDDGGNGVSGTVVDDPELDEEDKGTLSSLHDITEPPGVRGSQDDVGANQLVDSDTQEERDPERRGNDIAAASLPPDDPHQVAGHKGRREGGDVVNGAGREEEEEGRETVEDMNEVDNHSELLLSQEGPESAKDVQNGPQNGVESGSRVPNEKPPSGRSLDGEESAGGEGGEGGEGGGGGGGGSGGGDGEGDMAQLNSGQAESMAGGGEGHTAGVTGEEAGSSVGPEDMGERAAESSRMTPDLNVTDSMQPPEAGGSHDAVTEGLTNGNGAGMLSGQQKEKSVFLRLSNRIRDLEENMSLFSSYLDEISTGMKRNKNRTEDSQRSLEKRLNILNDSLQEVTNKTGMVLIAMAEMYEKVREMADAVHSMTVELGQSRREAWQHCMMVTAVLSLLLFMVLALSVCNRTTSTRRCSMSGPVRDATPAHGIMQSSHIVGEDGLLGATLSQQGLESNSIHTEPWSRVDRKRKKKTKTL